MTQNRIVFNEKAQGHSVFSGDDVSLRNTNNIFKKKDNSSKELYRKSEYQRNKSSTTHYQSVYYN